MRKPIAYVAGPLGFSPLLYREIVVRVFFPILQKTGFEIRDPWKLTPPELIEQVVQLPFGEEQRQAWEKLNLIIGANNTEAINESDIIVAWLNGTEVDDGTAAEIGYGAALHKYILGFRDDIRPGGENVGAVVNLQVEHFIRQRGNIARSEDELREMLEMYCESFYAHVFTS